jgi:DNA-directed RNA polymerase specialized sigma24 family protein
MASPPSVTTWIGKLRVGDRDAAGPLWDRYFARLVEVARTKLRGTARGAADEEDVALSAFHSLCHHADRFPELFDRQDLWQILVMLTARKAWRERRRQQASKRGGRREDENKARAGAALLDRVELDEIIGSEPDPQFVAMVAEHFQTLLDVLPNEELRTIVRLRMENHTCAEIAENLGRSQRTIVRKLEVIRTFWEDAVEP